MDLNRRDFVKVSAAAAITPILEKMESASKPDVVYPTGFPELDNLIGGGLRPGEVYTFLDTSMHYVFSEFRYRLLRAVPSERGYYGSLYYFGHPDSPGPEASLLVPPQMSDIKTWSRYDEYKDTEDCLKKVLIGFVGPEVFPKENFLRDFLKKELKFCREARVVTLIFHDPFLCIPDGWKYAIGTGDTYSRWAAFVKFTEHTYLSRISREILEEESSFIATNWYNPLNEEQIFNSVFAVNKNKWSDDIGDIFNVSYESKRQILTAKFFSFGASDEQS